ncbi:hypothetical protein DZ943_004870 [Pseudomonas aeruginosa]|uniref:hypothetical protein n=1 Tax=Pseudomonas aeruginosa TaxID=287 RepID=UPI000E313EEB|nr:hypothetical protein [Pseudomonas aeruginosa]NPX70609.1 hypothetical protein [Pseudomonas aeruginosa]NQA47167.1 hypothetical protein [Pseudomonas aeruginosa]
MSNCSHEAWDFGALQCPDCGAVKGHVADADYAELEAEVQALREEVAALRARVAVVPDGYALVPVEPTREMFIAIHKEDVKAYAGGCHHGAQFEWLWAAAIEAAPRPDGLTVSEGLLRRIVTPALTSSDAQDRIGALEELRALLSEQA